MNRAYVSVSTAELAGTSDDALLGRLAGRLPFSVEPAQRAAWVYQIGHLRSLARDLPDAHFFMEFLIPRMGRRADLIVIVEALVLSLSTSWVPASSTGQALSKFMDTRWI